MQLTYPGVYREEVPQQRAVPQGVSPSNLALVGFFRKGPVNQPVLISDLAEAFDIFGTYSDKSIAPLCGEAFFANGGRSAYYVRVLGAGNAASKASFAERYEGEVVGTGGGGAVITVSATLANAPIAPGSVLVKLPEAVPVLGEIVGQGDGTTNPVTVQTFEPFVPGSLTLDIELDSLPTETMTDAGDGTISSANASGTIDYVTGTITFTPTTLLVLGQDILANYTPIAATHVPSELAFVGIAGASVYTGKLSQKDVLDLADASGQDPTFSWTDAGGTPRTASASAGAITGDATGTFDFTTGDYEIDFGANIPGTNPVSVAYWYQNFLTAVDDGNGAFDGSSFIDTLQPNSIDYETGAIVFTTNIVQAAGVAVEVDYSVDFQSFTAKNPGESGDDLRVVLTPDPEALDRATGAYSRFFLRVEEETQGNGSFIQRQSFDNIVLDDVQSSRHIGEVINDPFIGSDLVSVDLPLDNRVPASLTGGVATQKIDDGTGSAVEQAVVLYVPNGGDLIPGSISITYSSGGETRTITDDALGNLEGDVNISSTISVDYNAGVLRFTPSLAPATGTQIDVQFTHTAPTAEASADFTGGNDGAALTRADVTDFSLSTSQTGMYALDLIPDTLLLLTIPDFAGDRLAEQAMINYVEGDTRRDSIAFLAPPTGSTVQQAISYRRDALGTLSDRAALFYPNLLVEDPLTGGTINVPPVCHVAGVTARTDQNRNIAKSAAGLNDGPINLVLGAALDLNKTQLGQLTQGGVNGLYTPPGSTLSVWGARTAQIGGEYRYIIRRRTKDFLDVTVANAIEWAVFENLTPALYNRVEQQVAAILERARGQGLLAAGLPSESFVVQCDLGNNSDQVRAQGQLIVEWGVALQTPGEFVRSISRQLTV
jgi:hypothetical protein